MRIGLYRTITRYTGQASLIATAQAVAINGLLLLGTLLWLPWPGVPRSIGVL